LKDENHKSSILGATKWVVLLFSCTNSILAGALPQTTLSGL